MTPTYGIVQLKEFAEAHSKNQSNPAAAATAAAVVNSLKVHGIVYFWLYICSNQYTLRRWLSLLAVLLQPLHLCLLRPPHHPPPNLHSKRMVLTPQMTCPISQPLLLISIRGSTVPCPQVIPVLFSGLKADLLLLVAQLLVACQVCPFKKTRSWNRRRSDLKVSRNSCPNCSSSRRP